MVLLVNRISEHLERLYLRIYIYQAYRVKLEDKNNEIRLQVAGIYPKYSGVSYELFPKKISGKSFLDLHPMFSPRETFRYIYFLTFSGFFGFK